MFTTIFYPFLLSLTGTISTPTRSGRLKYSLRVFMVLSRTSVRCPIMELLPGLFNLVLCGVIHCGIISLILISMFDQINYLMSYSIDRRKFPAYTYSFPATVEYYCDVSTVIIYLICEIMSIEIYPGAVQYSAQGPIIFS